MIEANYKELLQNLKSDKSSADNHKAKWDDEREVWVAETNGEKYGNEVEGKSTIVSRDIKKTQVWQHAVVIDPFVSNANMVRCENTIAQTDALSDQSQSLLNYYFCRNFDRYNFVSEAFKIFQTEGTVIARVGWEFEEQDIEVDVPIYKSVQVATPQGVQMTQQIVGYEKQIQTVPIVNKPTADNRDNKTLWIDPTEKGNISGAQFVIEHFKSSISKLTAEGIYENLDLLDTAHMDNLDDDDETYDDSDNESFRFTDKARAELDVYEYWGNYDIDEDGIAEPIVCTWVGDVIIRLEANPYPDRSVPYISCAMDPEPFSIRGRPNADIQSTDQKINTSIIRSIMDTLDSSTNGQRGFKEGTLDPANERKFKARKDFKYQGDNPAFWEGKHADINPSIINFYEMTKQNQAELTGVRPFAAGQGKYTSAKQVGASMDAVGKREVDLSRNFAENFIIPLLRKWLSMINEFLEPEEVERITGKPYVKPDPLDLDGNVNIRISVNTAESEASKAADISFMLQTLGQSLPFDLTKMLLAEQAELKKMPELAKAITEYQPQPDPMQQQMQQLEMQKLQAEIAERQSRAAENQIDMKLKESQTILNQAKARELHGKADNTDLEYIQTADGTKFKQELAKQEHKGNQELRKQMISDMTKAKSQQGGYNGN
jgi:hypothetical protein